MPPTLHSVPLGYMSKFPVVLCASQLVLILSYLLDTATASFSVPLNCSGFREIPEISEPEPKFKFRVRHRPNFAEPVQTRSNSEPVPRLGGDPSPSFVWSAGKWLHINTWSILPAPGSHWAQFEKARSRDAEDSAEFSWDKQMPATRHLAGCVLDASAIHLSRFFASVMDTLGNLETLHPFLTNVTKPVGKVVGSRRSGRRPRLSARLADPNNAESSVRSGKCKAIDTDSRSRKLPRVSTNSASELEESEESGAESGAESDEPGTDARGDNTEGEDVLGQEIMDVDGYQALREMGDGDHAQTTAKPSRTDKSNDIRTVFTRVKGHLNPKTQKHQDGHICKICVAYGEETTFLTGSVTTLRVHIARSKGHFEIYKARCDALGIEPNEKATPKVRLSILGSEMVTGRLFGFPDLKTEQVYEAVEIFISPGKDVGSEVVQEWVLHITWKTNLPRNPYTAVKSWDLAGRTAICRPVPAPYFFGTGPRYGTGRPPVNGTCHTRKDGCEWWTHRQLEQLSLRVVPMGPNCPELPIQNMEDEGRFRQRNEPMADELLSSACRDLPHFARSMLKTVYCPPGQHQSPISGGGVQRSEVEIDLSGEIVTMCMFDSTKETHQTCNNSKKVAALMCNW
ncbi:hypothetical protein C8R44DRAFT_740369 [Mycena epipterygia]|nr:hypothetical protein C8R44DRAFT_740369 [Mycena epipterygia]